MGNVTHRPKHKKKLAARKTRIATEKAQYKKYMTKQIEIIQEQIRAQQAAAKNGVGSPDIMVPSITAENVLVQQLGDIKTSMTADTETVINPQFSDGLDEIVTDNGND